MAPRKLSLPDSRALTEGADTRRIAPSAERNAAPILAELHKRLPPKGRLLELASGTGQHAALFAAALPGLIWQPTDANPEALTSITAWVEAARLPNLRAPLLLDAASPGWAENLTGFDAALVINLLHLISAPEAQNVITGMAAALRPGAIALIYGPFKREGRLTSDGDARFDADLRAQDPAIGYKDAAQICVWAEASGLTSEPATEMPANNLMLSFRKPA